MERIVNGIVWKVARMVFLAELAAEAEGISYCSVSLPYREARAARRI